MKTTLTMILHLFIIIFVSILTGFLARKFKEGSVRYRLLYTIGVLVVVFISYLIICSLDKNFTIF